MAGLVEAAWGAVGPFCVGGNALNGRVVHVAVAGFAPKDLAVLVEAVIADIAV